MKPHHGVNLPKGDKVMKRYGIACCRECGREFEPEELRYRANDGFDYCTDCGSANDKWIQDNGQGSN